MGIITGILQIEKKIYSRIAVLKVFVGNIVTGHVVREYFLYMFETKIDGSIPRFQNFPLQMNSPEFVKKMKEASQLELSSFHHNTRMNGVYSMVAKMAEPYHFRKVLASRLWLQKGRFDMDAVNKKWRRWKVG